MLRWLKILATVFPLMSFDQRRRRRGIAGRHEKTIIDFAPRQAAAKQALRGRS